MDTYIPMSIRDPELFQARVDILKAATELLEDTVASKWFYGIANPALDNLTPDRYVDTYGIAGAKLILGKLTAISEGLF